jgi:hypothetical protein
LIRKDQTRQQLQGLFLEGASSEAIQAVTPAYFDYWGFKKLFTFAERALVANRNLQRVRICAR